MADSRPDDDLYHAWADFTQPSKVLSEILEDEDKSRTLYNMIERQYKFISERSADDERGEMSVFDKMLVYMWQQEHQINNVGLLEFYLEEYLMAKMVHTYPAKKALVFAQLQAGELIDAAFVNPDHLEMITEAAETTTGDDGIAQQEFALDKLIRVYQEAKADFYFADADKSGTSNKCNDKFTKVRFLRDTAENLWRYMEAFGHQSHPLMAEVQKMVDVSARHAEHLAGGRRRIFELPEDEDTRPVGHHRKRARNERQVDSYRPRHESRHDRHERGDRHDDRDEHYVRDVRDRRDEDDTDRRDRRRRSRHSH